MKIVGMVLVYPSGKSVKETYLCEQITVVDSFFIMQNVSTTVNDEEEKHDELWIPLSTVAMMTVDNY